MEWNDILFKVHSKFSPLLCTLFSFPPFLLHSSFTCLQWTFEMLALACMYPWQPCNHGNQPNCLTLIVCMAAGPLDWRMCSMADAAGRFSSSIMANRVNTTQDRPYPSIQLEWRGKEGGINVYMIYIVLYIQCLLPHIIHYRPEVDLDKKVGERGGEGGTSLLPIPFHPGCTLFAM